MIHPKAARIGFISLLLLMLLSGYGNAAIRFDAEELYSSVFVIYSGTSVGSGFAYSKDGIITNAHVVGNNTRVTIQTYEEEMLDAIVVCSDFDVDIAILQVEEANFIPIPTGSVSNCKLGDDVYAIGAPRTLSYTLTKGIISAKDREIDGQHYIQSDVPINEGNSGGPLLTDGGEVIGINTLKIRNSDGLSLAIPIEVANSLIAQLKESADSENQNGVAESSRDLEVPKSQDAEMPQEDVEQDFGAELDDQLPVRTVLYYSLVAVGLLSIIIIALVYRKNRKKVAKLDSSDRTDFDIDVLE